MEKISEMSCNICSERKNSSELIIFSCEHVFCYKCSPYLLLSNIMHFDVLRTMKNQYTCPVCSSDIVILNLERLLQQFLLPSISSCIDLDLSMKKEQQFIPLTRNSNR